MHGNRIGARERQFPIVAFNQALRGGNLSRTGELARISSHIKLLLVLVRNPKSVLLVEMDRRIDLYHC